jgi:hypothetical protein
MNYLNKLREYLFEGFEYVSDFGAKLDYEADWVAHCQQDGEKAPAKMSEQEATVRLDL